MGVLLLDLNLRIEQAFGVCLEPRDWQELLEDSHDVKVEQLYKFILERRQTAEAVCLDIAMNENFWKSFQTAVARVRNCPVDDVQLSSSIDSMFPPGTRRQDLLVLEEELTQRIPILHCPHDPLPELSLTFYGFVIAGIAAWLDAWRVCWTTLGVTGIVAPCVAIFRRWRSSTREERWLNNMTTVKELVRYVRERNLRDLSSLISTSPTTKVEDLWDRLCEILIDSLGLDDDEVTRDAWLIKDLGCE